MKSQLEPIKAFFRQIIVISPVLFSFGIFPNDRYCADYHYDNVAVYYPRCFFLPRSLTIPSMSNNQKMSFDFRYSAVRRVIENKNIRFDLIHAHFTWPSSDIAAKLKEEFQVPVIATIHEDSGWLHEEISMKDPRLENAWRNADALIRVNTTDSILLKQYNQTTYSIPNGYTPEFKPRDMAECRSRLNLPPDTKILFTFGDFLERKGFQYLIEAMGILRHSGIDLRCYISGKGPFENPLRKQIAQMQLQDTVTLLEYLPTEELPFWINSADLFVFPSLQESFGIVQIEALACGKPVIAAKNAGSLEVIKSEDVGVLCEPADAQSLADAIVLGLNTPWDRVKILSCAKQYAWDAIAKDLLKVYKKALQDQPVLA